MLLSRATLIARVLFPVPEAPTKAITAILDKTSKKILAGPQLFTRGFIYVKESQEFLNKSTDICLEILGEVVQEKTKVDYQKLKNEIREKLGNYFLKETGSNPMIITVIQEL